MNITDALCEAMALVLVIDKLEEDICPVQALAALRIQSRFIAKHYEQVMTQERMVMQ